MCIDCRDLNASTLKDKYPMPVAEMLIDLTSGFNYLSMLDGYFGYNQIFNVDEDVTKMVF